MVISSSQLPRGVYRLKVNSADSGLRLDQFLCNELDWLSRETAKRIIDLGGVHVDGRRIRRCSLSVTAGQPLEVHIDGLPLTPFQLEDSHLLYRDGYLLVINKPSGVATQPTPSRFQGTLYAAVQLFLGKTAGSGIGMVQRLDRDTSGVMLFSTHPKAHKHLTEAFREHRVGKRYLALLAGWPPEIAGEIHSHLARRHATNRMVSVAHGGKPAVTRYRVLQQFSGATLVEVELLTGRSHQIRVHFAEAGCPLLGDTAYGGPGNWAGVQVPRQMLHASTLELKHPVTGAACHWQAPLPADFLVMLQHMQESSPPGDGN